MIVTIQGYKGENNHAVDFAGVVSATNAIKNQRRSVIMQFTNHTNRTLEKLMTGKDDKKNVLAFGGNAAYMNLSSGIDSLMRIAETTEPSAEDFSRASRSFGAHANTYDVVEVSQKRSFEEEAFQNKEVIENIITAAQKLYNDVFIVLPSNNEEFSLFIMEKAKHNFICFKQGIQEAKPVKRGKNICPVLTGYISTSKFNTKFYQKLWGVKRVFVFPQNVEFIDAAISEDLFTYLKTNNRIGANDSNAYFANCIDSICNMISGKSQKEVDFERLEAKKEENSIHVLKTRSFTVKMDKKGRPIKVSSKNETPEETGNTTAKEFEAENDTAAENNAEEKDAVVDFPAKDKAKSKKKGFFSRKEKKSESDAEVSMARKTPVSEPAKEDTEATEADEEFIALFEKKEEHTPEIKPRKKGLFGFFKKEKKEVENMDIPIASKEVDIPIRSKEEIEDIPIRSLSKDIPIRCKR